VQLNSALMGDIVVVHVGASAKISEPLHLGFVAPWTNAVAVSPRVLVVVEKGASLTLIEHHISADGIKNQINSVVELLIDDEASCEHIRINAHGHEALALSTLAVKLGAKSELSAFNVVTQPAVSRHQVFVTFAGENAQATINGAALLKGKQHADLTLVVDHAQPHGTSRETFKTVLDGSSTGVFQGQIQVKAKAQKTDGRMSSNALMLSDDVTMYNKPELEIFADDVQCAHGATCGALDDDLLFYLLARGISRTDAEGLMVQAFVGDALEPIRDDTVREALMGMVEDWVKGRRTS
jgi:Fe-S cluster assembly protein SufD